MTMRQKPPADPQTTVAELRALRVIVTTRPKRKELVRGRRRLAFRRRNGAVSPGQSSKPAFAWTPPSFLRGACHAVTRPKFAASLSSPTRNFESAPIEHETRGQEVAAVPLYFESPGCGFPVCSDVPRRAQAKPVFPVRNLGLTGPESDRQRYSGLLAASQFVK